MTTTAKTDHTSIARIRHLLNHRVEPATAVLTLCATTLVAHLLMWMLQ